MNLDRLVDAGSRIAILLKDLKPAECKQCLHHGGISCILYPGSRERVVISPVSSLGPPVPPITLTLPAEEYDCPIPTAMCHEIGKVREDQLKHLQEELDKITPI